MNFYSFLSFAMFFMLVPIVTLAYPTASSLMRPSLSQLPPLHYHAYMGELSEVEHLLATGAAKINDLDDEGNTALHWAVFGDTTAIAERLITGYQAALDIRNATGQTFLANAAALRREDMLKLALAYHATVNGRNIYNKTPLLEAITASIDTAEEKEKAAKLEVITELLLAAGADPNIGAPIGEVAEFHNATILKQLLDAGADPNRKHGRNARPALLLAATWANDTEKLRLILAHDDVDLHAVGFDGLNAMDLAVHAAISTKNNLRAFSRQESIAVQEAKNSVAKNRQNVLESVRFLLAQGLRPNTGFALVRALFNDAETAQILMDSGVDLHQPDHNGTTPLMAAAAVGDTATIETILATPNVDVEAADNKGQTALAYANSGILRRGVPALQPLLKHGVSVDNEHGRIAFRTAIKRDDLETVELLLARITAGDHSKNPVPSSWVSSNYSEDIFADYESSEAWLYRDKHVLDFAGSKAMVRLLRTYGVTSD